MRCWHRAIPRPDKTGQHVADFICTSLTIFASATGWQARLRLSSMIGEIATSGLDIKLANATPVPTDNTLAALKVSYSVKINEEYAESIKQVLQRLEETSEKQKLDPQPHYVSFIYKWSTPSVKIYDTAMIAMIGNTMKKNAFIGVLISVRDENDTLLDSACQPYETTLFGHNLASLSGQRDIRADFVPHPSDPVLYLAREEKRTVTLTMPEELLARMRTVSAGTGCQLAAIQRLPLSLQSALRSRQGRQIQPDIK